ncbi:unnamed protein product [Fusarium graminearum]|uniref:Uncharacterized protein n=1 Tax=Gibberella zeae TaxID=5518 RepID=A0A4E9E4T4_GIBZA|nr:unnamed protein product [Fusarium graminearum]
MPGKHLTVPWVSWVGQDKVDLGHFHHRDPVANSSSAPGDNGQTGGSMQACNVPLGIKYEVTALPSVAASVSLSRTSTPPHHRQDRTSVDRTLPFDSYVYE